MANRHGRAVLPWGKYKGVRIRLVPDDYLSFLTTTVILQDSKWDWLRESLLAELRHRGFRADLADEPTSDFAGAIEGEKQEVLVLEAPRHRRAFCL
jgi:uncharacterized protein (DUF3820 family)